MLWGHDVVLCLVDNTAVFDSGCWLLGKEEGGQNHGFIPVCTGNSDLEIAR